MDADTGQIVASILTEQDDDDPSQVGPLLDQIEHQIGRVLADGAYDGAQTYETIALRDPLIEGMRSFNPALARGADLIL